MNEEALRNEVSELRKENLILAEKLSALRKTLARDEQALVQVLLTLDNKAQFELKPGVDFDSTISAAFDKLFSGSSEMLRVAIPYISAGGAKDFQSMIGQAIATPAEIRLVFRHPDANTDFDLHRRIHEALAKEIAIGKVKIRYMGEAGRSGLHAKVVIKDMNEAIVSSANWTGYSMSSNAEVGLLTRSQRAVRFLAKWFDFSYQGSVSWKHVLESRGEK